MKLIIVESPAKAKTIEKYLSRIDKKGDFVVRASVGHVRDLPKSNKKAIDIEGGFVPHYEVVPGKVQVIHELRELAHKAGEVILATDPDREGEAIAWHIQEELGLKKPKRIVFYEITEEAIKEALAHPRTIRPVAVGSRGAPRTRPARWIRPFRTHMEKGSLRPFGRPRSKPGAPHHYGARARDTRVQSGNILCNHRADKDAQERVFGVDLF